MFWKERECECVTPASLLSPGAQGRGGGAVTRGADPVWSRPSRASEPRPLLRHELTHPGISMPSPDSALVRCSRRHALGPRSPRVARRRFGIGGAAAAIITPPKKTPAPNSFGNTGAKPLAGRRGVPHPHGRCRGSSRVAVAREEARPQQRRVWIPRIPPPDKEA